MQDAFIKGLNIDANIGYNQSRILKNDKFPDSVGKNWIRIPRVRSAITATYKATEAVTIASTYRYQGRQFNELNNSDSNPDVYAGLSRVKQWDVRVLYRPWAKTEFALGVDNALNKLSWQSHPFPGRTLFIEARHRF
jgi:iron complex outermembrane recepter protein